MGWNVCLLPRWVDVVDRMEVKQVEVESEQKLLGVLVLREISQSTA